MQTVGELLKRIGPANPISMPANAEPDSDLAFCCQTILSALPLAAIFVTSWPIPALETCPVPSPPTSYKAGRKAISQGQNGGQCSYADWLCALLIPTQVEIELKFFQARAKSTNGVAMFRRKIKINNKTYQFQNVRIEFPIGARLHGYSNALVR